MATHPVIERRVFQRRATPLPDAIAMLSAESQAALRQFDVARLSAYGMAHEDANEMLGRVLQGQGWRAAARQLFDSLADPTPEMAAATASGLLFRKAALGRASQMMMIEDTAERRDLFEEAAALYARASAIKGDRIHFTVRSAPGATLTGWRFASERPMAAAIVWGGIEGWAMDFAAMGEALAARGIVAYLIDGPGQGEARLRHGVYFDSAWRMHWRAVVDHVERESADLPLFMIGNSMGGCMVMNYAPHDARIAGICSNGGPLRPPPLVGDLPSKLRKFVVFCGDADAGEVWGALDSAREMSTSRQPLLILQGGADPLVAEEEALRIASQAGSDEVQVSIFSDGDHCIYNHPADKHDLISEWIRLRARRS